MLRSRGLIFLFLFLFLARLQGSPAAAMVLTFDDLYTADVPPRWEISRIEPGYTMLVSPDQKAVFLITSGLSMHMHRDKTAEMLRRFNHLRIGSPDRYVTLMRIKQQRVAVTIIGDHADRVKLYRSIVLVPRDWEWRAN